MKAWATKFPLLGNPASTVHAFLRSTSVPYVATYTSISGLMFTAHAIK